MSLPFPFGAFAGFFLPPENKREIKVVIQYIAQS